MSHLKTIENMFMSKNLRLVFLSAVCLFGLPVVGQTLPATSSFVSAAALDLPVTAQVESVQLAEDASAPELTTSEAPGVVPA